MALILCEDLAEQRAACHVFATLLNRFCPSCRKVKSDWARNQPDGTNVNHRLVKDGWCWWYRKYAPGDAVLEELEKAAREERKGLWADPQLVPPWEWRKGGRRQALDLSDFVPLDPVPENEGASHGPLIVGTTFVHLYFYGISIRSDCFHLTLNPNKVAYHLFINARRAKLMRRAVPTFRCSRDTAGKLRA